MDERQEMPSFYLTGSGHQPGSGHEPGSGPQDGGLHVPPGYKTETKVVGPMGALNNFANDISMSGDGGKKKRGRPRKYGDGSDMAVTGSLVGGSPGSGTDKKNRGRPPGSGRKQRLADVGEWMSTSAGLAFTPHIIHVEIGEDVAAKIESFAQQRPRALCIMSGNGSVSTVQLRQFASSGGTLTYEGRFEILSLSGSYLISETTAPNNRTGGLSISISSSDGHVIGGAVGGRLIASSLIQVVACSFVYGGNNSKKTKTDTPTADEKSPGVQLNEPSPVPSQAIACSQDSQDEKKNIKAEIDLTSG